MADHTNNYSEGYRAALMGRPMIKDANMEYVGGFKSGKIVIERMLEGNFEYIEKDHLE